MEWCGLHSSGLGQGKVKSSCECDNEPSGSIKYWETIECLSSSAQLHSVSYVCI
jgi:hypothetical protein